MGLFRKLGDKNAVTGSTHSSFDAVSWRNQGVETDSQAGVMPFEALFGCMWKGLLPMVSEDPGHVGNVERRDNHLRAFGPSDARAQ